MKKSIAFIINPISGGIPKHRIPQLVAQEIDSTKFDTEIFFTESTQHNKELAQQCVLKGFDAIIAVGGDGTINNTAKYIAGTKVAFGIVPLGSGNGLARHLGLSKHPKLALQTINNFCQTQIDTGTVNNEFFINVAGVGFDAHVTGKFAVAPRRGFWQYAKITLAEFAGYKARHYELIIDGIKSTESAFLICVANGSQYGNNAYISPLSIVNDGVFEVTILRPFKLHQMPQLGAMIFRKNIHQSSQVKVVSGKHIIIKRTANELVNIDGEPVQIEQDLDIKIHAGNLKIICNE